MCKFFFFGIFSLLSLSGFARIWTSSQGSEIDAEFVKSSDTHVTLKLENGKTKKVKLSQLSEADQAYVTELKEESPERVDDTGNWDEPWPEIVRTDQNDVEITVVIESPVEQQFIYHSNHFEFVCDVPLKKSLVKKFAWYFESTYNFIEQLPLSFLRKDHDKKHKILLFETKESYIQAGGPPKSGGVYIPNQDVIMVPLTSVGVKKVGSGYSIDYKGNNETLSHEITHQLQKKILYNKGALGWFTEGMAEYVSLIPYRSGIYNVKKSLKANKENAVVYSVKNNYRGAQLEELNVLNFKDYALQPYSKFTAYDPTISTNIHYLMGALSVYYFIHLGGEEELENFKNFAKAIQAGEMEASLEKLLNGRTYDQLEEAISSAWKLKGVDINFQ